MQEPTAERAKDQRHATLTHVAGALLVAAILWVAVQDGRSGAEVRPPAPDTPEGPAPVDSELDLAAPPALPALPEKPGPVRVRVVDGGGAPLAGVEVGAILWDGFGDDAHRATGVSDPAGEVLFGDLRAAIAERPRARHLEVAFPDHGAPLGRLIFPAAEVPDRFLVLVWSEPPGPAVGPVEDVVEDVMGDVMGDGAQGESSTGTVADGASSRAGPSGLASAPRDPVEPGIDQTQPAEQAQPAEAAPSEPSIVELLPDPVLPPVGAFLGHLHLDPDVPAGALRVELDEVLPLAGTAGRRHGPVAPAADGSFRFDGVAPGLLALRVSLLGTRRTLVWVDDLELDPGAELRDLRAWCAPGTDPEAGGVDLRDRLVPIDVELLDEFGRRLDPAVVTPFDRATGERGLLELQTEGATPRLWGDRRVLQGAAELDLLLIAPDRAVREVSLSGERLGGGRGGERGLDATVAGGQALAFELQPARARPIELRLVGWPGGPGVVLEPRYAAGLRLEARLEREDGRRFPWDHERHRGELDERGRLRLAPADPGRFVVRLAWIDEDGERSDLDLEVPIEVGVDREDPEAAPRDVVFLPVGRGGL